MVSKLSSNRRWDYLQTLQILPTKKFLEAETKNIKISLKIDSISYYKHFLKLIFENWTSKQAKF